MMLDKKRKIKGRGYTLPRPSDTPSNLEGELEWETIRTGYIQYGKFLLDSYIQCGQVLFNNGCCCMKQLSL